MNHMCRDLSVSGRRRRTASVLLRHARFVTDPKKLAQLYAQADKRKRSAKGLCERNRPDDVVRNEFPV